MGIRIENLSKSFGSRLAVDGLSLTVKPGEVMGLLGPNGAGKSTTMRILTGGLLPSAGDAFVNGVSVVHGDGSWRVGLGYLPEQNPLYFEMYTYEYLRHVAELYHVKHVKAAVERVATLTGLLREKNRRIGVLSKGYKQRVGLAAALIADPKTLILDEPTNGLDPNQIVEIRRVIREVGNEKAVLLSTHIMQEVEALCDSVAIVNQGRLMAVGKTSEVVSQRNSRTFLVGFQEQVPPETLCLWFPEASIEQLPEGEWALHLKGEDDIRASLYQHAVQAGYTLVSLYARESHLEDVFRNLTVG